MVHPLWHHLDNLLLLLLLLLLLSQWWITLIGVSTIC